MGKALTREDLLYILQSIFRLSQKEDNAFQMLDDGLYVKRYQSDLSQHTGDKTVHINEQIKKILDGLSVSENGLLLHDGIPIKMIPSKKEGNSLTVEPDGIYVPSVAKDAEEHLKNKDIHVTADDKENWNGALENAKKFTEEEIGKLTIYGIEIVGSLPPIPVVDDSVPLDDAPLEDPQVPEPVYPSSTTLYLLANDPDCPEECTYTMYMYLNDKWAKLGITNKTLAAYALKKDVKNAVDNAHKHENGTILGKFTEDENGNLLYNNSDIRQIFVSDKLKNAITLVEGKLFAPDYSELIRSLQVAAAFSKENLLAEDCDEAGTYELRGHIDDFSVLIIDYYHKNDEGVIGNAKSVTVDVDTMNDLYTQGIDYMLDLGYGISVANSKIKLHDDKLIVNYYHGVCIYKITGIRKGDTNV